MDDDDGRVDAEMDEDEDDDVDDASSEDASSSEGESSDGAFDDQKLELVMELERACEASNHADRGECVRLIDACRAANLRERLREARERAVALHALDETRWSEWIQDELSSKSEAKQIRLERCEVMFDQAMRDCGMASVKLVLGRARVSMELGRDWSVRRDFFERAVATTGLNYADGHLIWQAYRAFEVSHTDAKTNERVKALFERQLKIPHAHLEKTLESARQWAAETSVDAGAFEKAHALGATAKTLREPFEERLAPGPDGTAKSPADLLRAYGNYIDFEISSGTGARVAHLYERALGALPYVGELWCDYAAYMYPSSDSAKEMSELLERALRICPLSTALWKFALKFARGDEFLRRALATKFRAPADYADVLTAAFIASIQSGSWLNACSLVKDGFKSMVSSYSANSMAADAIGVLNEVTFYALAWHDKSCHSDVLRLFDDIREEAPFKTTTEFHIVHADFVTLATADVARALEIYDLALQRGVSEPMGMSKKSVEEKKRRRAGAEMLTSSRMRILATLPLSGKSESAYASYFEKSKYAKAARDYGFDVACERLEAAAAAKARKNDVGSRRERAAARREGRLVGNTIARKRVRDVAADGDKVDVDLKGMDHDARVKALFPERDSQTAFVKNLSWDVTESELEAFFGGLSGTVSVRIVKDKDTGRSRGFAYVDFSEESALNAAIMRSGQELKGRALDISKSRPPPPTGGRGGRGDGGRGRGGRGGRGGRDSSAAPGPGRGRGGLGLTPRAVRTDVEHAGGAPKTNADFRAMFVKPSTTEN